MAQTPNVTITIKSSAPQPERGMFDVRVTSASVLNPDAPAGGTLYAAWCLNMNVSIPLGATYKAWVFSPYEAATVTAAVPTLRSSVYAANYDNINWLLNHYSPDKPNIAYGEIQSAIWQLLGFKYPIASYMGPQDVADIDALVAMAKVHEGYVPDVGEAIGIVLDPTSTAGTTHYQPLILKTQAAKLGDFVWEDLDADGVQDAGEQGIAGATVELVRDSDGNGQIAGTEVLATTVTDLGGHYSFKGLTPALEYQVRFTRPAGFDAASPRQADGSAASGSNSDALLSSAIVLSPGQYNTSIDAGFYRYASLGDRVWLDTDGDGQQDGGESGIAGQAVTLIGGGADGLIGTGDDTTTTLTTDADGSYRFTGLTPGVQYQVVFSKPEGAVFSGRDSGDDLGDSDADSLGRSQVLTLGSGEDNNSVDAGVYMPVSIGNRVWEDIDADGLQDAGEPGMAGVTVQLRDATNGAVVATTTTNAQGNYLFSNLLPGYYGVQFVTPTGYVVTESDTGGSGTSSSSVGGGYVLTSGQVVTDADGGFYRLASLGDRLWLDANGDGRQDAGEAGIAGQTVTLVRGGADRVVGTADDSTVSTTTDASGYYRFTGLMPGAEYQVVFSKPGGTVFTARDVGVDTADSDADAAGRGTVVTLKSSENNTSLDAGVYAPASIGDRAWEETNGNGVQDSGEAGIAGVTVQLRDASGAVVATTTTDAEGHYGFTGLRPGQYDLQFATPDGFVVTRQDVGADGADSDIDGAGLSGRYTLASGDAVTTVDAGFFRTASLGNRLWLDANGNGQQDAGEQGIAGQTVTLVGGGADGLIGTGDDTTATVTTDANGNYRFTGLTPGVQHQVVFAKPEGSVFTTRDSGDDLADSDADADGASQVVTLASGEDNTSLDAGVLVPRAGIDIEKYVHAEYTVQTAGGGTEGLTPGFWKNHTGDGGAPLSGWPETGLTPGMSFEALFGVDVPGSAPTLLQALGTNGGGVNALLRHAGAALLNASHPNLDFLYTPAQVIALVKQAFATGSYETVKDLLATQNEKEGDLSTPATGGTQLVVTDDVDADTADAAALIPVGGQAVFTYVVKNTGDFEIADVQVTDDRLPSLAFVGGDTDGDGRLDAGESWTYRATETVPAGAQQVLNIGTATGRDVLLGQALSDSDAAWYSTGATPPVTPPTPSGTAGIDLEKLVHAEYDAAASASGGEGLTPGFWKNHTGDGGAPLLGWPETGLSPAASYEAIFGVNVPGGTPTLLQALGSEGGDVSALLRHSAAALLNASNPNVSYLYSAAQVVAMVKQAFATSSYEATKNLFAAQNELGADLGSGGGTTRLVTEDVDADTAADALLVPAGAEAVYTYVLKNTGSVALDDVSVSDDHLSALAFAGGDANGDGRLDVGETWTYTARETVAAGAQIAGTAIATGHGAALGTVASDSDATHVNATAPSPSPEERVALSFDFSGSGPIDGADGNTRSYSMDGVSVTASAFSRDKSGQWAQAYLGAQAGGLGVTDASENGSGQTYAVDNSGRDNYLVFQFSSNVVVDEAFLGAVVGDSDLTAWIGSSATPLTSLSDALLAGLAREESDGGAAARWADLNAAGREGNLLVIAASVKGGKADDQFLLDQLGVTAAAATDDLLGLLGTLPQHAAVH